MEDAKIIWDELMKEIKNPYGVAGLMGNLFAESSLNPLCKTGGDKSIAGWQYAQMVDDLTIGMNEFAHDGVAFGLAQWKYWSRKEKMYDIWGNQRKGTSIGSLEFQIPYLLWEIQTYKTVWNTLLTATSVKEASDIVLVRYEKPANQSDKAKEKRAAFGQEYFDKYYYEDIPTPQNLYVRTTANNVIIRSGNDKSYAVITRADEIGTTFPWIATSENMWHAVVCKTGSSKKVGWICGDFAEVIRG